MDHPFVDKVWELSANKVIYYYNYYDCYILYSFIHKILCYCSLYYVAFINVQVHNTLLKCTKGARRAKAYFALATSPR